MDPGSFAVSVNGAGPTRDDLNFLTVSAPELCAPEKRGGPSSVHNFGLFYKQLIAATEAHGISADQIHVVVRRLVDLPDVQVTTFAFGKRQKVIPIRFESEHFEPWIEALLRDHDEQGEEIGRYRPDFHLRFKIGVRLGELQDGEVLENSTADWLREHRPESWKVKEDKAAKTAFVKQLKKAAVNVVEFGSEDISEAWSELVRHNTLETEHGATDAELQRFAKATRFDMPPQLEVLLRLSNGATRAFGWRDLLSVDEIIAEWRRWKKIFDERLLADLQGSSAAGDDRTVGIYTNPHWIPFASESGNSVAVDLLPGPTGRQGQIIYFGADESHHVRVLADDLASFIRRHLELDPNDDDASWF